MAEQRACVGINEPCPWVQREIEHARVHVEASVEVRVALKARLAALESENARKDARIAELEAALRRIAHDEETSYMACSDVPWCNAEKHDENCAVGIARAALTSTGEEGEGERA